MVVEFSSSNTVGSLKQLFRVVEMAQLAERWSALLK